MKKIEGLLGCLAFLFVLSFCFVLIFYSIVFETMSGYIVQAGLKFAM